MDQNSADNYTCEEIIELINRMVDNEITEENLELAQELINENPQCCALYQTLIKTVDLCRKQHREMVAQRVPEFRWKQIMERAESEPDPES